MPADPKRRFHWSVHVEMYLAAFSLCYAAGSVAAGRYGWAATFVGICALCLLAAWDLDRRRRNAR